jgi:hypothetical protein
MLTIHADSDAFIHLATVLRGETTRKVSIEVRSDGIAIKQNESMWSPTLNCGPELEKSNLRELQSNSPEAEYFERFEDDIEIFISKVGGGTIGHRYEGTWKYWWYQYGELIHHGADLTTGTPKTHDEAIRILFDFIAQKED